MYSSASPLENALLVYERGDSTDASKVFARLVNVDDGLMLRKPLFSVSDLHSDAGRKVKRSGPSPASRVPFVSPHPNGDRVCVALYDNLHHGYYLVELTAPFEGLPEEGTRLTTTDARLDPESVAYSPDGDRIGYLLTNSKGHAQLWVLQANGRDVNGVPIAAGISERRFAFGPLSNVVLFSQYSDEDAIPHALVVSATDGELIDDLGVGRVGHEAWHPSGSFVVVAAPDSRGEDQVWAIETTAPYRRQQLTTLENGVGGLPAVSRDGAWVAAFGNTEQASMVFVDVSAVQFSGADHA